MSSSKILTSKSNYAPITAPTIEKTNDLVKNVNNNNNDNGTSCNNNIGKNDVKDNKLINKNENTCNSCMKSISNPSESTTCKAFELNEKIDVDFEYKGYYKFGRILGRGSFGTVVECFRKSDEKPIALKFFKKTAIHKWIPQSLIANDIDESLCKSSEFFSQPSNDQEDRLLPSEVASLVRARKCDGVVKIIDYIPTSDELCSNSDSNKTDEPCSIIGIVLERDPNEICLFDYLIQNGCLPEKEAKVIMKQIFETSLHLLQDCGILHGDLKSENILINPETKKIKLIDFGSAQIVDASLPNSSTNNKIQKCNTMHKCNSQSAMMFKPVRTFRGTNLYKPPEYIIHHCFYPRPSTVWTFGNFYFL